MMETMRLIPKAAAVLSVWMVLVVAVDAASGPWDQPAGTLADKIAAILGPGQARLVVRNLSSIPASEVATIRKLLEDDLRARGVALAGEDSANAIRVTLSESVRGRLWVAEVVEGNATAIAMVQMASTRENRPSGAGGLTLRRQTILRTHEPMLTAFEAQNGLVVLEPEEVVLYVRASEGFEELKRISIGQKQSLPRDPRGLVSADPGGAGFRAWLAGEQCTGPLPLSDQAVACRASDDPWPVPSIGNGTAALSAFYNPARNFFTGVVTPNVGVDLPRFYSSAWIPRAQGGAGLLIAGIDGKAQMLENGALKPVSGTRDWGSDLAALNSGCGAGWQILVSGSGAASSDSLRAFEIPALEAVPAGAPIEVQGTVTSLWPAPDFRSAIAIVRGANEEYEVDRVTALCN
jgi:hypothetical protein